MFSLRSKTQQTTFRILKHLSNRLHMSKFTFRRCFKYDDFRCLRTVKMAPSQLAGSR